MLNIYDHFALLKKSKTTVKLSGKSRKNICLIVFNGGSSIMFTLILLMFLTVALHESGTKIALLSSVYK